MLDWKKVWVAKTIQCTILYFKKYRSAQWDDHFPFLSFESGNEQKWNKSQFDSGVTLLYTQKAIFNLYTKL